MVDAAETTRNVKGWDLFNKPTNWYVHLGLFFVIGFIAGFMLKNFGRYVIMLLIIGGLVLWGLELLNIVTIHYSAIKSLLGFAPDVSANGIFADISAWVQTHIAESIAAALGFLFSWMFM